MQRMPARSAGLDTAGVAAGKTLESSGQAVLAGMAEQTDRSAESMDRTAAEVDTKAVQAGKMDVQVDRVAGPADTAALADMAAVGKLAKEPHNHEVAHVGTVVGKGTVEAQKVAVSDSPQGYE